MSYRPLKDAAIAAMIFLYNRGLGYKRPTTRKEHIDLARSIAFGLDESDCQGCAIKVRRDLIDGDVK